MVWFWVTSVKGSVVSWFNNRSFKMVDVANDYAVETLEPQLSWFHRWFPFLQWSPSSPQDLKIAEEELLSSKWFSTTAENTDESCLYIFCCYISMQWSISRLNTFYNSRCQKQIQREIC